MAGGACAGAAAWRGMCVGGPEAEKWAVGILFYILTRRLPALTLQIRGKWTCEVQLILETPNEIYNIGLLSDVSTVEGVN